MGVGKGIKKEGREVWGHKCSKYHMRMTEIIKQLQIDKSIPKAPPGNHKATMSCWEGESVSCPKLWASLCVYDCVFSDCLAPCLS